MWTADAQSAAHHGRGSRQRHAMPRASLWRRDRMNGRHTRGILRWLVFCSCEALADAVAGNAEARCYGPLRETTAGEHADAAILRHGQQINDSDDGKEKEGHLKDGRERKGNHRGSLGREGAGPVQRIGRGGSFSPGRTGRDERRIEIIRGERRVRDLLLGAHVRMIGTD